MTNIILFDLDGTLTEARSILSIDMYRALQKLSAYAEIGIISGSGIDYITEQLVIYNECGITKRCIPVFIKHILACNGTQYHKRINDINNTNDEVNQKLFDVVSVSMRETMSVDDYKALVRNIAYLQLKLLDAGDIPVSGEFISYRGSMINWSPIGRTATMQDRKVFVELDNKYNIRRKCLQALRTQVEGLNVTCVLGGQTSFDIYPIGWDKSYALQHFDKKYNIFFIGDKCEDDGNDATLYNLIDVSQRFKTHSLECTINIINEIISRFSM